MSRRTIVAIDGPAGAGKSTVAKLVAERLGIAYVDTGATYRLVAFNARQRNVALDDARALSELARETMERTSLVDGSVLHFLDKPVGEEIRTAEVSEATSIVSAHPEVRSVLVDFQRRLVPPNGAVVEGRDIGTVVWPNADLKVYLDAAPDVRAERRAEETEQRDTRDASRPVGAMRAAPDAFFIDTTNLSQTDVADRIVALINPSAKDFAYAATRGFLSGLLRGIFRMQITGRENIPARGPLILAPNHRSLLDIPVAAATTKRKVWFMAKEELFASKLSARILGRLGAFPVRRGRPDRAPLQRALKLLADGEVVGIFPEGTRRPMARFEELEEGFAYVALRSGAPVVPVAISGTEAVFPPGGKLPRLVKVRVAVGEPFRLGDGHTGVLPRARVRSATADAAARFATLMNALEPR
ncbi:MAG TPA: (d)CMP kinase [Actinomycetota bacterium]|jgi:cytidylate kinase|nr:(d)CMP kinase [Actinomycetota bacterium]